jgi:hypothetical protein
VLDPLVADGSPTNVWYSSVEMHITPVSCVIKPI